MTNEQKFIVAGFRQNNSMIEVDIQNITTEIDQLELEIEVKIPQAKFFNFLLFEDKLAWEINYSDHTGKHVQNSGNMTIEEYFLTDEDLIYNDLYEYITTHPINFRGQLYVDSVNSILLQFAKHSK